MSATRLLAAGALAALALSTTTATTAFAAEPEASSTDPAPAASDAAPAPAPAPEVAPESTPPAEPAKDVAPAAEAPAESSSVLETAKSVIGKLNLDVGGYLRFDKRFMVESKDGKLVHPGVPQFPMYHQAFLQLKAKPIDNVEAKISAALRYYDFMVAKDLYGLQKSEESSPIEALLWEAYVDVYGLGTDRLDLRVGKQRIAWGTADRFNPTDNLNPLDLTDFMNFGERVPSWAIKADFTIIEEKLAVTGVLLAGASAVSLPRYASLPIASAMTSSMQVPEGFPPVTVGNLQVDFKPPAYDFEHTMQALKAGGNLGGVDWSVSYFHGYMDLPIQTKVKVNSVTPDPNGSFVLDVTATTELAEEHVLGLDLAGEFLTVGWWAEAALTFPREVKTDYDLSAIDPNLQWNSEVVLRSQPYLKYTVGLDYTMPWGTYLNFQFVQGFFTERSWRNLDHYFLLTLRHKFFNEKLTIQAAVVWETDLGAIARGEAYGNIEDNYGVVFTPEITIKPYDNIDITLGYLGVFTKVAPGNSMTLAMYDEDQAYLKLKASF
ncbi:MAG: hypothetical protein QM765_41000 [Myxococcales bacterium]